MRIVDKIGEWAIRVGNRLIQQSELPRGLDSQPSQEQPRVISNQLAEQILQDYLFAQQNGTFDREQFLDEVRSTSLFQKLRQLGKDCTPPMSLGPDFEWLHTITEYDKRRHRILPGTTAHTTDSFLLLLPHFQSHGGVIPADFRAVVVALTEVQTRLPVTLSPSHPEPPASDSTPR